MKVALLQHQDNLPPGELGDYFARRHQAVTVVLKPDEIREGHPDVAAADLIVSLGSPVSVYSAEVEWVSRERRIIEKAIARGTPLLGICFGAQMIASLTGGSMTEIGRSYVGWFENDTIAAPLWRGPWFRFHKDQCELGAAAEVLARSEGVVQAFQSGNAVGLQFHPEMNAEIVQELAPSMRQDFGMAAAGISALLGETRLKVDAMAQSRDSLFDEVLRRYSGL